MSFNPVTFLDDPPKLNLDNPTTFEAYIRDLSEFVRRTHIKQRQLGLGVQYDIQDRVEVPIWFLWMYT